MTRIPIYTRRDRSQAHNAASTEAQGNSGTTPHRRPAGTDDEEAAHEQSSKPTRTPADLPDPTVVREDDRLEEEPTGQPPAADPTVPPASQPIDTKSRNLDILGSVADEVEGPGGADVAGGEITAPKDADAAVEENIQERTGEVDMWERQHRGEVDTQTDHLKPSSTHPEEGMPANPDGRESSSGGSDESATEGGTGGSTASASASGRSVQANGAQTSGAQNGQAGDKDEALLRLAADFENFKRQATRRESEARERAIRTVLEDLLPVLDNFERALQAAKNARDVESLRVGVEFIAQQLRDTLKNYGVEPIEAQGQKFDPLHHEALEEVTDSGHPEGTVVDEAQRGYSYKGQVLRPSRVRVAGK